MLTRRALLAGLAGAAVAGSTGPAATASVAAGAPVPLPACLRHLGDARQSIVVTSASWRATHGTLTAWERDDSGWVPVIGATPARLGHAGMRPGWHRHQLDGTTPAGSYRMTSAFGVAVDPGSGVPYTHVTSPDLWWVGDRRSRWYNELRRASAGGFRLRRTGIDGSEQLIRYPREYRYAAVVDFNRPRPVVGRGSGIFLHCSGRGATAGCVSVPADVVAAVLRWLDPGKHPVITIAPLPVLDDH